MTSSIRVDDDEVIYRRVTLKSGWVDPHGTPRVLADAFLPHKTEDTDGLSVSRAKTPLHPEFLSAAELAGLGPTTKGYYVLELRARDFRAIGLLHPVSPGIRTTKIKLIRRDLSVVPFAYVPHMIAMFTK